MTKIRVLHLLFLVGCLAVLASSLPTNKGKAVESEGGDAGTNSPTSQASPPEASPQPQQEGEQQAEEESAPSSGASSSVPNESEDKPGPGDSNPTLAPPDAPKPILPNEEEGVEGEEGKPGGSTGKPGVEENSDEDESDEDEGDEEESEESDEEEEAASEEGDEESGEESSSKGTLAGEESSSESFEYNALDQFSEESESFEEDDDDDSDSDSYSYEEDETRVVTLLKSKKRQLGGNDIDSDFGELATERDREPGSDGEFVDPYGEKNTSEPKEDSTSDATTQGNINASN